MTVLPMFPLGTVIFPYTAVPLRVFEPRYHALLERVRAHDGRFGTVLIERGFEVGGGDRRFSHGTLVEVVGETSVEGGSAAIVVAGLARLTVQSWLDDDPHPWAEVEVIEEGDDPVEPDRVGAATRQLQRVMAMVSELGVDTATLDLEVSSDPVVASYQIAALTPVVTLDSYRLLSADGADARLELAEEMLSDQIEMIRAQLGGA